MDLETRIKNLALAAQKASLCIGRASGEQKNAFLRKLSDALLENREDLLQVNKQDVSQATAVGMDAARLDRLTLTPKIISQMAEACLDLSKQPDPIGATETQWQRPNGLLVGKMRVPLGVIAMIYEARPNVTIEAAILAIKAGNSIILRGGREAVESNRFLMSLVREALKSSELPENAAQLIWDLGHEAIPILCRQTGLIDLLIPRGGENLVRAVCENATVPVLMHYKGVCHAYIDASADIEEALAIVENSKVQRPGVCNALECLLVNKEIAKAFLPKLGHRLAKANVEFHADLQALKLLGTNAIPLQDEDLGKEFHSLILAVIVVEDMEAAIKHIDRYGSHHTDIICTRNYNHAMRFLREVDSSMVAVNASTRFNDGGELGLGAEIGISTSKLHAYGPMGVKELTTAKYVVLGSGQIRK